MNCGYSENRTESKHPLVTVGCLQASTEFKTIVPIKQKEFLQIYTQVHRPVPLYFFV